MTTGEVVESLGDRLWLGGRKHGVAHHRTLRDRMQWSYDLLDEAEQRLFDRLSVFAGRFSREAALAVGADRDEAELKAKALVAEPSGGPTTRRWVSCFCPRRPGFLI
jgi:predicted ATPase